MNGASRTGKPPGPGFSAILFAEDFDDRPRRPAAHPPAEPETIEPSFSLAELEAARQAAHAQGLSAGLAQNEDAHRQAVRVAVQAIGEALREARGEARDAVEASAAALARTLLATLCAALPVLCARHGEAELRDILRALLPSLTHEPVVNVRVHPSLAVPLGREIAALGAELTDVVVLTSAETLLPGDARIAWQHGSANRDTGVILAEIDDALGRIGLREAAPRTALHIAPTGTNPGGSPPAAVPGGRIEELANVG